MNFTATKQDINEFVAIDDERSHLFQKEILEEAKHLFEEQQAQIKTRKSHHMRMSQLMLTLLVKGSSILDNV